ncbi:MAG: hypothetical protein AUF67_13685 [Acidobacteria bacterium 13_1_20CM_58_21]|nr:MAG: hypothetical protein AUF67_13685 [Acidobacteria bacterium 13_1_20CM_58_21]
MKIEAIALREIHMRLKAPFETSFGIVQNRRILLVETIADGVSGWGEVTASETPGYNAETTETAWHVLSDFIAPSVIGKNILDASEFPALMSHIRGHEMAINIKLGHVGGHTEARCVEGSLPPPFHPGLVRGDAGIGYWKSPQRRDVNARRVSLSLATFQPVNVIGTRTLSSPRSRSHRWARSMFPKYQVWHI